MGRDEQRVGICIGAHFCCTGMRRGEVEPAGTALHRQTLPLICW